MSSLINIVLADDQYLTRNAIRAVLKQDSRLRLIAEAVSSQHLLSMRLTEPPHILLLSWQLFPHYV
jgi:DNA-binding NarL/FixJ family response regulator